MSAINSSKVLRLNAHDRNNWKSRESWESWVSWVSWGRCSCRDHPNYTSRGGPKT